MVKQIYLQIAKHRAKLEELIICNANYELILRESQILDKYINLIMSEQIQGNST